MTSTAATTPGSDAASAPRDASGAQPAAVSGQRGLRRRFGAARLPLILGLLVVLAGALIMWLQPGQSTQDYLRPDSTHRSGAKAVAQVLTDRGVRVRTAIGFQDVLDSSGRNRTLLVQGADALSGRALRQLPEVAHRIVLINPSPSTLEALDLSATARSTRMARPAPHGCVWPAAVNAGPTDLDGTAFQFPTPLPEGVQLCYPPPDEPEPGLGAGLIAVAQIDGSEVILIGSDQVLRNDSVSAPGRAALALWTLGADPELLWWNVDPADPGLTTSDRTVDPLSLLPNWFDRVHWWGVVVVALAILWRSRRLGRLVPEPLPVLVRSAETVRGRAALYRRAGARDRAAAVLRADVLRRLARRFGLPADTPPHDVVRAVSESTGWQSAAVTGLLTGPPPRTDADLVALARELDRLLEANDSAANGRGVRADPTPSRHDPRTER